MSVENKDYKPAGGGQITSPKIPNPKKNPNGRHPASLGTAIERVLQGKVAQTLLSVREISQLPGTDKSVCATLLSMVKSRFNIVINNNLQQ